MPEAAATIAAARIGAADLGIANLYGSCVFNVTILAFADPFYREGVLNSQSDPAHIIAGLIAILLILAGLVLIMGRDRIHRFLAMSGLMIMAGIYIAGAVVVATLGAPESEAINQNIQDEAHRSSISQL